MYCPSCSQKQISDDIRFCSACGFPLADVAEALENKGYVERNVVQSTKELKKDITKGVVVMTLSSVFFILSLIMGTPEPSFFVQFNMLVGILFFIFGLILIGYSFFKKPNSKSEPESREDHPSILTGQTQAVLQGQKAGFLLNEQDLSEFADINVFNTNRLKQEEVNKQPPSVAERTTRLLSREE